jgi:hypothetical protein
VPDEALAGLTPRVPLPEERKRRAQADAAALAIYFHAVAPPLAPEFHQPTDSGEWRNPLFLRRHAHSRPVRQRADGGAGSPFAAAIRCINCLGWVPVLVAVAAFTLPQAGNQHHASVTPPETVIPAAPPGTPPVPPSAGATSKASAPPPSPPEPAGPVAHPQPGNWPTSELTLFSSAKSTLLAASSGAPDPVSNVDTEPGVPAAHAGSEGFVAVVFTHRNASAARHAFVTLQQIYPKQLAHRQGEAQPVDFGNKGIWHRLVVLPPKPRRQAALLCDQLLAAGYHRCWVKAY